MLTAYGGELLNPYKSCVRELLNCLAYYDNEYQRTNVVLRNLQTELKQEVDNVIFQCSQMRKLACASEERLDEFQRNIKSIDTIRESFNNRIEEVEKKRQEILIEGRKCFEHFCNEKLELKKFHERSINHLKAFAVQTNNPVTVRNCEKDINEMSKRFVEEVSYIKKCESVLRSFLQVLHDCKMPSICNCSCLDNYDFMPGNKSLEVIEPIINEIKVSMGNALRKTFAQIHIHKPKDVKSFAALHLMSQEHNEELMLEKLKLIELDKQ